MNIHILSDLHLDHAAYTPEETIADLVILAGDIAEGDAGVLWAKASFNKPTIYVPGNHEFYDSSFTMNEHIQRMKQAAEGTTIHVLNNEVIIIDGVRFIGSTMWSSLHRAPDVLYSDQSYINVGSGTFSKEYAQTLFETNREWLKTELEKDFNGKTVVITHHGPSKQSVHAQYAGNEWNPCFVTDVEQLMGDAVCLWVHGHTHNNFDYVIDNKTRVICNPRGYPRPFGGWENESFEHACVVSI